MVESHWEAIRGKQLRYSDHTWELTGDVDVLRDGAVIAVAATQVDGVQHDKARLFFGIENPPGSLNPGNLGEHFDSLVREDGKQSLQIEKTGRTYRYELRRIEYP